ncbi:hypothetical protein K6119_06440 [Paracrocinitomix mangrovi]|uniref:hypothetical protein n=1 Tax=Paracrocinitomix mangrovi TaxID=2862509 RepID=UPI001C8E3587|nr:hypothetical protein [Paracrocinitomix mangrovi]UKN03151.1 hypothetical protein K6119_06440 [Paracrocinitomix mangrovi]
MRYFILFISFISLSASLFGQLPIHLPLIDGSPKSDTAPPNWTKIGDSPDLIKGNGEWPGGSYTMENIDGGTLNGESMGLFLCNKNDKPEGWSTTLKGLEIDKKYAFSLSWQQCVLTNFSSVTYSGGDLAVIVNGKEFVYSSDNGVKDKWQNITVEFTAASKEVTVELLIKQRSDFDQSLYGSAIVVDNVVAIPPASPY